MQEPYEHSALDDAGRAQARLAVVPSASVVIPAYNQAQHLAHCLAAILEDATDQIEVIVVDDASTDATVEIARAYGVRVVSSDANRGPAHARNIGVQHARADILIFVDGDVVVAPGAVRRMVALLNDRPEIDAVFGSYDTRPHARTLVSEYRNLLHHFTHQTGEVDAATFWAGCGAIRRPAFEAVGGFDERSDLHYIEDVELGYRLRRSGARIRLDKHLLATHRKHWRLSEVIKTDTLRRARPWARLILQGQPPDDDLNLRWSQRAAVALTAGGLLLLPFGLLTPAAAVIALLALAGALALNASFLRFLWGARGLGFTLACLPLHLIYHLSGAAGFVISCVELRVLPRLALVLRNWDRGMLSWRQAEEDRGQG